jgi:putative membrane protein
MDGVTPLTTASSWSAWHLDWPIAVLVLLLGTAYGLALGRIRQRLPVIRTVSFTGGLLLVVLVTMWWPGAYDHELMWVFTLQVITLLAVAGPLLCLGRPLTLAALVFPQGRLRAILDARPLKLLTSPVIAPLLVPIALAVVFFTPLLVGALRSDGVLELTQLGLLIGGVLFALPLAGDDRERTVLALTAGIFIGFLELFLDAVPGIVIRLTAHPIVTTVASLRHPWGPSPLTDQQHAGSILWFLAEFMDIPFLALLFVQWARRDKVEAAKIDEVEDDDPTPWWLKDPERFDARRAAEFRRTGDT